MNKGFCIWLTGLSGSGKTTIAQKLAETFNGTRFIELMDGDEITQAESWLLNAVGKDPAPTDLHKLYIESSRKQAKHRQHLLLTGVVVANFWSTCNPN